MRGRYPRTVREFAENQRAVMVWCGECQLRRTEAPDVLAAMFGDDFDVYDGFAALTAELRCAQCGKKHRTILIRDLSSREMGGLVSSEEALTRSLEMRAYWTVRDAGKPEAVRGREEEAVAT